jgi:hypothetical protein
MGIWDDYCLVCAGPFRNTGLDENDNDVTYVECEWLTKSYTIDEDENIHKTGLVDCGVPHIGFGETDLCVCNTVWHDKSRGKPAVSCHRICYKLLKKELETDTEFAINFSILSDATTNKILRYLKSCSKSIKAQLREINLALSKRIKENKLEVNKLYLEPGIKWKIIEEFPNYLVSTDGRVRNNIKGTEMNPFLHGGYLCVTVRKHSKGYTRKIHRLVAKTFIDNPNNYDIIDHINNVKTDNNVLNLRWVTCSQNTKSFMDNYYVKKSIIQLTLNKQFVKRWKNIDEILNTHQNFRRKTLYCNIYGGRKNPSAYGFLWKYETNKKAEIELFDDEIFENIGIIEDYDFSNYEISNYGTVRTIKGKYMKHHKNLNGYLKVNLRDKKSDIRRNPRIHRLVAYVFIENDNPDKNIVVNHIDENKQNNYFENLEWVTDQQNTIHSIGKPIHMLDLDSYEIINTFDSLTKAEKFIGVKSCYGRIRKCCNGDRKSYGGYIWVWTGVIYGN